MMSSHPLEILLGRAVYCLNVRQIFRPSWMSDKLKKLLLHGVKLDFSHFRQPLQP